MNEFGYEDIPSDASVSKKRWEAIERAQTVVQREYRNSVNQILFTEEPPPTYKPDDIHPAVYGLLLFLVTAVIVYFSGGG